MNSTSKGDELEDAFYNYLLDQQDRGEDIYGIYPPGKCKIFKKKKYQSRDRGGPVQFDVVIELFQPGRTKPHLYVVFECKHYKGNVPDDRVREFSDKLREIFPNRHKGIMVVSSKLQAGARNVAESRGLGVAKFDRNGLEITADRKGNSYAESRFVESQIFEGKKPAKSLKFSACYDGRFFSDIAELLAAVEFQLSQAPEPSRIRNPAAVPYVSPQEIKNLSHAVLMETGYQHGAVDLAKICLVRGVELRSVNSVPTDLEGFPILGTANFSRRTIQVYAHNDSNRERFTIGHEIGHFCLGHDRYLKSDNVLEKDLIEGDQPDGLLNYERLEVQANAFAADLLLPDKAFINAMVMFRSDLGMRYKGHGFIFVDNQPENLLDYQKLLTLLSLHFEVSKTAVEIKLKKMNWLNDQRTLNHPSARLPMLSFSSWKREAN